MWGPDVAVNRAYLEWKHERNPYIKAPLVYLALHDGRIVGMRGLYGSKWQVGSPSQCFTLPVAADFLVSAEHRKRGLARKLTVEFMEDMKKTDFDCILSLSAGPATRFISMTCGWRCSEPIREMHWEQTDIPFRRRLYYLSMKVPGLSRAARVLKRWRTGKPFATLDRKLSRRASQGTDKPITISSEPRPEEMAGLIERLPWDGRIRHVRDEEFFQWRYRDPPLGVPVSLLA